MRRLINFFYPSKETRINFLKDKTEVGFTNFKNLESIDEDIKQKIYNSVKHFTFEYSYLDLIEFVNKKFNLAFIIIVGSITVIGSYFVIREFFIERRIQSEPSNIYDLVLYIFPFVLFLIFINFSNKLSAIMVMIMLFIFFPTILFVIAHMIYQDSLTLPFSNDGSFFLMYIGLIFFLLSAYGLINYMLLFIARRQWTRNHPNSVVVVKLIELIGSIERRPFSSSDLESRRIAISDLIEIANRIQYDMPGLLKIGDAETDNWINRRMKMIAAALRDKKDLLLSSNPDDFIDAMVLSLIHSASGSWLELEYTDPKPISRSEFFSFLNRFLRAFISGIIPLGLFLILQQTKYTLESPLSGTVLIITIIWFVISILPIIDPLYKEKVDAVKSIRDLLP